MKLLIFILIIFVIIMLSIKLLCRSKTENMFLLFKKQPLSIESKQDYKLNKRDDQCSQLIIRQENIHRKQEMLINNKKRNQHLTRQDIQELYQIQQQLKKYNCVVSQ